MRNNSLIKLGIFSLVLAAAWSCAPRKRLVSSATEYAVSRAERREVIGQVDQRRMVFTTFSGRAKGRMSINKDDYDLTANVRIQRDSAIWISVTALMGIEAGRILITPDSIKLVNRLRSEYAVVPYDHVHRFTDNQLDFYDLQELLVGNVPGGAARDDIAVWATDNGHVLRRQERDFRYGILLNTDFRPLHTELENSLNQHVDATYGSYRAEAGHLFPHQVAISISADGLSLRSEMNYTRVAFDEVLEMPFNIPSTYREIQ